MESDTAMINPTISQPPMGRGGEGERTADKMVWDITVVDKLLYLLNSIVLLTCGVLLLLFIKPVTPPQKSINCFFPKEFVSSWMSHGEKVCLSKNSTLHVLQVPANQKDIFNDANKIDVQDILPGQSVSSSIFSSRLFLMAILSLIPFLLWRVIGSKDGRQFISPEGNFSAKQTITVFLWFVITKLGAALLCGVFVYLITDLKAYSNHYLEASADNRKPDEFSVFCTYWVRRIGDNFKKYTVTCIISKGGNEPSAILNSMFRFENLLPPVILSLQIWLSILLAVTVVNLIATTVLAAMCSMNSYRSDFIKRNLSYPVEQAICYKMDLRLGTIGALVSTLATRLGYGSQVRDALNEIYKKSSC